MDHQSQHSLSRRTRLSIALLILLAHLIVLMLLFNHMEYAPFTIFHEHDTAFTQEQQAQDLAKHLDFDGMILSQSPHDQGATVIFEQEQPTPQPSAPVQPQEIVEPTPQEHAEEQPHEEIIKEIHEETQAEPDEQPTSLMQEPTITEPEKPVEQPEVDLLARPKKRRQQGETSPKVTLAQVAQGFLKS